MMAQMTALREMEAEATGFSRAAIRYAVRELALRAGVAREDSEAWRVEVDDLDFVNVFVKPGSNRRIRFPRATPFFWKSLASAKQVTSTATWATLSGNRESEIRDFKIPFSSSGEQSIGQLFVREGLDSVRCSVDLLASLVLVLSRFEETLPVPRDEHGRFSAFSSIAWQDRFLHRPIVDEWGFALADELHRLLPGWKPVKKSLRVKLGHDVDELGLPFHPRTMIAHILRRRSPRASFCDLRAFVAGKETTYQKLLRELVSLAKRRNLDTAVYWKCTGAGPHDTGYNPQHPSVKSMISSFREMRVELGVHPSYQSYDSPARFRREIADLRDLLGDNPLGGRQDFLRWRPDTWVQWEAAGMAYDASVGFADHIGFRAGTCHPYHPWLLSLGREAELLEIPLLVMDSTLLGYMRLQPAQTLEIVRDCIARCRTVGGVFTLVWHNTRIMNFSHKMLYQQLLDDLVGTPPFDWSSQKSET
jgi:hypothetical protein